MNGNKIDTEKNDFVQFACVRLYGSVTKSSFAIEYIDQVDRVQTPLLIPCIEEMGAFESGFPSYRCFLTDVKVLETFSRPVATLPLG